MHRHALPTLLLALLSMVGQSFCCLLPRSCGEPSPSVRECGCCCEGSPSLDPDECTLIAEWEGCRPEAPLPGPRCGGACFKANLLLISAERIAKRDAQFPSPVAYPVVAADTATDLSRPPRTLAALACWRAHPPPNTLLSLRCGLRI